MLFRKKLKKIIIAMIAVITVVGLTACGKKDTTDTATDGGNDEIYELKLAHVVRPTHPKGMAVEEFKKEVEEKSNGRIQITVYPDSQMGNDQEINEQILNGTLDMNAPFLATLTSFVPQYEVFDLPYLFKDSDRAFEALQGKLGEKLDEYIAQKGFESLGYWTGGFKQLTNSKKPVKTVEDLDGLKIRASQSPALVAQFRALNAGGISVPFNELYTALQNKTVDGQENPLSNIATKKFYEVQDYLTMSDHGFMGYNLIINKQKFDGMPEDLQEIIREAAKNASKWEWEKAKELDDEYLQEIKDGGMEIDSFDENEKAKFLEKTQAAYDEFMKIDGAQELLDIAEEYKQ
ncbi:MAG: TRAP transporter substrate-binding protein [Tissierellia bacterium]|nr:TRAP transporter substrate-binding protein [Tissierellia bacterium]